jgi:serine/threonine protein kinase
MRFEREARVLASLSHPNIAPIFGVEESGATRALVRELVEGPALADRIAAGALPVEEALDIATKIAGALEYAHDHGVVHRDLKPANVKITPEGAVKVLDFGLAKAIEESTQAEVRATDSPTLTMGATRAGVILGTAAYMAPEQAKGKTVDRRADIWAFGVVLFEMLTGRPVFSGETAAEIMASAIKDDPKLERLSAGTPEAVRRLIERCLNKDPKQRLQAIGEARIVLDNVEQGHGTCVPHAPPAQVGNPRHWMWPAVATAFLLALGALSFVHFREKPPEERVMRTSIAVPENSVVGYLALSPDGRRRAASLVVAGNLGLWLRPLATAPGSEANSIRFDNPELSRWSSVRELLDNPLHERQDSALVLPLGPEDDDPSVL